MTLLNPPKRKTTKKGNRRKGAPRGARLAFDDTAAIKRGAEGSLRRIARSDGGLRKDGKISKTWARRKLASRTTSEAVKRKLRFFLNFNP